MFVDFSFFFVGFWTNSQCSQVSRLPEFVKVSMHTFWLLSQKYVLLCRPCHACKSRIFQKARQCPVATISSALFLRHTIFTWQMLERAAVLPSKHKDVANYHRVREHAIVRMKASTKTNICYGPAYLPSVPLSYNLSHDSCVHGRKIA
jgi:hypothetical protein